MPDILEKVVEGIVNPTFLLMTVFALVYFLWGVMKFVLNMDNETERDTGKRHMVWGIVGLTIMVSVWGIINVIMSIVSDLN
ncbi:MAG: hypothetical protein WDZ88_00910 [Candidatus Paceibacterota bacterium]